MRDLLKMVEEKSLEVAINSNPLEKKEVQSFINKLFSPIVVGNVSFQVVDHYA